MSKGLRARHARKSRVGRMDCEGVGVGIGVVASVSGWRMADGKVRGKN